MAVPRLEQIVARLQLARHHALVEDRLDASPPTVRFRAELRRGPWGAEDRGPSGVMELSLAEGDAGPIRARTWLGDEGSEPHSVRSIAVAKLDAATVEQLALSFLEDLVARA